LRGSASLPKSKEESLLNTPAEGSMKSGASKKQIDSKASFSTRSLKGGLVVGKIIKLHKHSEAPSRRPTLEASRTSSDNPNLSNASRGIDNARGSNFDQQHVLHAVQRFTD
jgi:hypothetical protein